MTVSMDKKYVTRDGLYNAKVIYIHDKGDKPVIVFAEYKKDGVSNTTFRACLNGQIWPDIENGFDLIEVPENTQDGWVKFDAENDEVPFLHMHDMIEAKYKNGYQSPPIPAWSVDFDTSRDPVTAYRIIEKAEQPEKKPALTLDDYYDAFVYVWNPAPTLEKGHREGIKAVLKLAGVKV